MLFRSAKILEDAKEPAGRQVRVDLAVAAIIKAENIEISDEDAEAEYQKLAEQYNMELDMVKKYLPMEQVKDQLASRKAVEIVTESATATKPEKKEAEEGEKKPKRTAKKAEAAEEGEKPAKKTAAKKTTKKAETEEGAEKPKTTRKKKTTEPAE